MSGAALAVGSKLAEDSHHPNGDTHQRVAQTGTLGGVMGSLKVIQLQLVAFILVFTASGLVPYTELAFPILITVYSFWLNSFIFPHRKSSGSSAPDVFKGNRFFQLYVVLGTVVGLFLPLAFILGGFSRGDQKAVRAATPHLFLLSCQILSENFISKLGWFSLPVRALLPLFYTAYRLITLRDWLFAAFFKSELPLDAGLQAEVWMWFGRILAAGNFLYYSINLCCFLVPMFLPRAFEMYFNDKDGGNSKTDQKPQPKQTAKKVE